MKVGQELEAQLRWEEDEGDGIRKTRMEEEKREFTV